MILRSPPSGEIVSQERGAPRGAGHRHPQDGAKEVIHQRIRPHTLPAQNLACQESKLGSKKVTQIPLEMCPVTFSDTMRLEPSLRSSVSTAANV